MHRMLQHSIKECFSNVLAMLALNVEVAVYDIPYL